MDNTYHCAAGETWDGIALKIYGHEKYACDLLRENPLTCLTDVFEGGEIITLPEIDIPTEDEGGVIAPATAPWKE